MLAACGWLVQTKDRANLSASRGVAISELSFATGEPDYTLFVDGRAIGTLEAKQDGETLTGIEEQSNKYDAGVPFGLPAWMTPLPFCSEARVLRPSSRTGSTPNRAAAPFLPFIGRRRCWLSLRRPRLHIPRSTRWSQEAKWALGGSSLESVCKSAGTRDYRAGDRGRPRSRLGAGRNNCRRFEEVNGVRSVCSLR